MPITLTLETIADDAARKYGHDRSTIRSRLDALRLELEAVDETTIHPDHIDPVDAADLVDAYARTYARQDGSR